MRSHSPVPVEEFMGLYDRGDPDRVPFNHFRESENLDTANYGMAVRTRDGIGPHQTVVAPLGRILRIHNYVMQTRYTLLVLRLNDDGDGEIYHVLNSITVLGPILTIDGMTDFKVVSYNGRAYISPFSSYGTAPAIIEKGVENEFLYVYEGDGTPARKAAGAGPGTGGTITVANATTELSDAGFHLFGVLYEYDTGYLTAPGYFTTFTSDGTGYDFSGIPVSADPNVVARRIVMTKEITNYNGDTTGYDYFFIPDGRIPNNTSTVLDDITVFDLDLLEDASHLVDNYAEIPAGAALGLYHDRLVIGATFDDISLLLLSAPGEPEAIDQILGVLVVPLDGNPITHVQELRDILYVYKRSRTVSYVDNGGDPSEWEFTIIDQAIGCPVHGVATVIDSGGVSVDFLISCTFNGIMLFNGQYVKPELSWKIQQFWADLDRNEYRRIQIVNSVVKKRIFIALPDRKMLVGDYSNGMDPQKIKWWPWKFDIQVNTVALTNIDDVILGSETRLVET